jgi:hypothetical protein
LIGVEAKAAKPGLPVLLAKMPAFANNKQLHDFTELRYYKIEYPLIKRCCH